MEKKKSYVATLLLAWFLGGWGIHRFYTGHIGIGVAQLLTAGGCGIWALVDLINICFGNFKTADGQELEDFNPTLGKIVFGIVIACWIITIFYYTLGAAEIFGSAGGLK